jgi:hypothetical protein
MPIQAESLLFLFLERIDLPVGGASFLGFENSRWMFLFDMFRESAHWLSWPDWRRVELLLAEGAPSDADVRVGNSFEKYFLFHACIMPRLPFVDKSPL